MQYEARLIRDLFYQNQSDLSRFLPVVLPGGSADDVPGFLTPATTTVYRVSELTVGGAEALLRVIHQQPGEVQPIPGPVPDLPIHPHHLGSPSSDEDDSLLIGTWQALPRLQDISDLELGATPTRYSDANRAPYVPRRAVDEGLAAVLSNCTSPFPILLIWGPTKSGKTRTAIEALRSHLGPETKVIVPSAYAALTDEFLTKACAHGEDLAVLWLDDPEIGLLADLTVKRINQSRRHLLIVVTMSSASRATLYGDAPNKAMGRIPLLRPAAEFEVPFGIDEQELQQANSMYPGEKFSGSIAETLIGGRLLLARYRAAVDVRPAGCAIVRLLVDLNRARIRRGASGTLLQSMFENYLFDIQPNIEPDQELFRTGLKWAARPIASSVALIQRRPNGHGGFSWQAFDHLASMDDGKLGYSARSLPKYFWPIAIASSGPGESASLGFAALAREEWDAARLAWSKATTSSDQFKSFLARRQLLHVLSTVGDTTEANKLRNDLASLYPSYFVGEWYQEACDLFDNGQLSEATVRLQQVIDTNLPLHGWAARRLLAGVHILKGNHDEAERMLAQIMGSRHVEAAPWSACHLAQILADRGETARELDVLRWAASWYIPAQPDFRTSEVTEEGASDKSIRWLEQLRSVLENSAPGPLREDVAIASEDDEQGSLIMHSASTWHMSDAANFHQYTESTHKVGITAEAGSGFSVSLNVNEGTLPQSWNGDGRIFLKMGEDFTYQHVLYGPAIANLQLGHRSLSTNAEEEARKHFQAVVDIGRYTAQISEAHFYLGALDETGGDHASALSHFKNATVSENLNIATEAAARAAELMGVIPGDSTEPLLPGREGRETLDAWIGLSKSASAAGRHQLAEIAVREALRIADAITENQRPELLRLLATILNARGLQAEANEVLTESAEEGDVESMLLVANRAADEPAIRRQWLERASIAGSLTAMNQLAWLAYEAGDHHVAKHWWERAAEAGSLLAARNLYAVYSQENIGDTAIKWLDKAARGGSPTAMDTMAEVLAGRGDHVGATIWRLQAKRRRMPLPDGSDVARLEEFSEPGWSDPLNALVDGWVNADTFDAAEQYLRAHPELMSDAAVLLCNERLLSDTAEDAYCPLRCLIGVAIFSKRDDIERGLEIVKNPVESYSALLDALSGGDVISTVAVCLAGVYNFIEDPLLGIVTEVLVVILDGVQEIPPEGVDQVRDSLRDAATPSNERQRQSLASAMTGFGSGAATLVEKLEPLRRALLLDVRRAPP